MDGSLVGCRVLVAEDEPLIAMMVEDMLGEFGCALAGVAATNAEAMALLEGAEQAIDVAVLDVTLADGRVTVAAQALRRAGVPVVFATGDRGSLPSGCSDGAVVVEKPYDSAKLRAALIAAIDR